MNDDDDPQSHAAREARNQRFDLIVLALFAAWVIGTATGVIPS